MLSGGAQTEAQLLDKLGEWTYPEGLAEALGKQSVGFGSGTDAIAQAEKGPMIARLQAPRCRRTSWSPSPRVREPSSSGIPGAG